MSRIKAEIITIGDEILYGQTLDTNSHWISKELDYVGIRVICKTTIGDNREDILKSFKEAEKRAEIVLITGGLGPTSDDLTKPLLTEFTGDHLIRNQEWLETVTRFFEERGRKVLDVNKDQALIPSKAILLKNLKGTAPGIWIKKSGKIFIAMPGVPYEMKYLMKEEILPRLKKEIRLPAIKHRIIKTIGIGESALAEIIKDWEKGLEPSIRLAYLPGLAEVKLRLTATGEDLKQLTKKLDKEEQELNSLAKKFIYGRGEDSIQSVVSEMLKERGLTLAAAESCSGGYVSHLITSLPGSSEIFQGSVIAYHNEIKIKELNVNELTLKKHGAVSEETVEEMAAGVRAKFNTDVGLAISGIAGPGGGTEEKPVGTIWICADIKGSSTTKKLMYNKDRLINIKASSKALLNLLRIELLKNT